MSYFDEKSPSNYPDIELEGNFIFVSTAFDKLNDVDIYPPGFFLENYSQDFLLAWFYIPISKKDAVKRGFIFNDKVDMNDAYLIGFLIDIDFERDSSNPGFDRGIFHLNPKGMVKIEGVINNFQVTYTIEKIDIDTLLVSIYGDKL